MNVKDKEKHHSRKISFRLTERQAALLDREAERREVNTTELIREALDAQPYMLEQSCR